MKTLTIFLDADGTLWNSNSKKPWNLKDASLDPHALSLLKHLNKNKIDAIIISYQSHTERKKAKRRVSTWLKHFKIAEYINEVYIADKKSDQKYKVIKRILNERKINPKETILIGDRYKWD